MFFFGCCTQKYGTLSFSYKRVQLTLESCYKGVKSVLSRVGG